ncbi:4488_t:CDS:2 [Diversispora eburnea]|uniref:4488_t:CDS:1 n=1 Tax=Diversispora eburnea TaxID=1213867 RepID=A0A9N8ZAD7_9GLOM|nr:4488_t:CDS:2 [Diversispora eburnea]
MVAIKVTYGASVHKFNVAVDSTWATFEHNLRTLFKIPDNYKVIASYTDEDNDVITLSSDIELCEVLDHHSNDNNTPVRLVLNAIPTANNSNNKEIQETFEKMTIADDEKCCDIETETETENEICEKSSDEKCCNNKSSDEKCCEDEEEQSSSDPEVYYFVRSKRGPRFGSAKFDSPRGFHGHLPSHPPPEYAPPEYELHRKHHGEFEEFGPHGECCKEGKENHKDDKECNKGEKCEKDTIDPCVERDPPVHRPPGSHRPHHSLPAFPDSYPHGCTHMRGHHHGHHPGFRGRGHGHVLAEKVALLNSMNFPSDKNAHYEELLKKFHGRIEIKESETSPFLV